MISITKDLKSFIEDCNDELMIYGAGNSGYWTGYYMNKCQVDFSCYLDNGIKDEGTLLNGKPILLPSNKLKEYNGKMIRIFVSITAYQSAVYDLLESSQKYGFYAQCYIPLDYSLSELGQKDRKETYAINATLGYFRKQLFNGSIPTILSNDCTAGSIYQTLGLPMASPTINAGLLDDDFIKLCRNPKHYFDIELDSFEMGRMACWNSLRPWSVDSPCSRIDDITIYWGHTKPGDAFLERWNIMRKKVNYDNMIFCMSNLRIENSYSAWKQFSTLKQRHLAIMYDNKYVTAINGGDAVIVKQFIRPDTPIENYFDLLGWINEGNIK